VKRAFTEKLWKIYWQRQDLKWHSYTPAQTVKYFEEFLSTVDEDANCSYMMTTKDSL
jgi:hypothetical protein